MLGESQSRPVETSVGCQNLFKEKIQISGKVGGGEKEKGKEQHATGRKREIFRGKDFFGTFVWVWAGLLNKFEQQKNCPKDTKTRFLNMDEPNLALSLYIFAKKFLLKMLR